MNERVTKTFAVAQSPKESAKRQLLHTCPTPAVREEITQLLKATQPTI